MPNFFVHESSIIEPHVTIGNGTKIWHFCHLMPGVVLGKNCNLGQNVFVASDVRLGNNVKVQNNVSVYSGVVCEDDVFLGPSMVFTNILNPRAFINRQDAFQNTLVKKGASIGANATIICGIQIGAYALVGAGSVVTKSVADFALVVGNPARQTGWVSIYGHRLQFDEEGLATCPESGQRYQLDNNQVQPLE